MCIVVYKPKGLTAKKDIYEECFRSNKDGAGFIVREKTGEMKIQKGYFSFEEFWDAFQPHQHKQAIIHFRIKTHGNLDQENCHPFWVKEGSLAFAHNGVIGNETTSSDITKSDTWHFNKNVLQHLHENYGPKFIEDPIMGKLISEYIGYSKLAFMREDGKAWIFNKGMGVTDKGIWYSNHSYKSYSIDAFNKRNKNYKSPASTSFTNYTNLPAIVNKALDESAANDPIIQQGDDTTSWAVTQRNRIALEESRKYQLLHSNCTEGDRCDCLIQCSKQFTRKAVQKLVVPDIKRRETKTLMEGDYIQMIQVYGSMKGTEIGKILAVHQDYTVDALMHQYGTMAQRSVRLPYHTFEKYMQHSDMH